MVFGSTYQLKKYCLNTKSGMIFLGIWSPGQPRRPPSPPSKQYQRTCSANSENEPVLPIWTPKSANSSPVVERKEFRPLNFQSPVLGRKNRTRSEVNHHINRKGSAIGFQFLDYSNTRFIIWASLESPRR